jgi:hypothetical protein
MKYKGIGFNGPHLAAMPFEQFSKEVAHQLNEAEQKDCYDLLQLKYPGTATVVPDSNADDNIAIPESADAGSSDGSVDNEQPRKNKRGSRESEC